MLRMRSATVGLLVLAALASGCRQDEQVTDPALEPTTEPVSESVVEPRTDPVAKAANVPGDVPAVTAPATEAGLSAEQKAALARMQAAGADVKLNEAGFPVYIDLASERVFANEELVRAALLFPNLTGLRLAVSSVPQSALAELAALTGLEELFLQDAAIDDVGLTALLAAMPGLRRLTLRRLNNVTDGGLVAVGDRKSLEVVALIEMNQFTGIGVGHLAGLPRLRCLDLRNCGQLALEDFQHLAEFKTLVELKLAGPAVNDAIADVIFRLPQLRSLTIEDAEISSEFLTKLAVDKATAERLETLAFARCFGINDEALTAIGAFSSLQTLSLRDIMLSGQFLVKLSEKAGSPLPVTSLTVTNAFLDDAAIGHLPVVAPNLERLDVRGNPGITDASKAAFEKLNGLKEINRE